MQLELLQKFNERTSIQVQVESQSSLLGLSATQSVAFRNIRDRTCARIDFELHIWRAMSLALNKTITSRHRAKLTRFRRRLGICLRFAGVTIYEPRSQPRCELCLPEIHYKHR